MANNNSHSPYRLFQRNGIWHARISLIVNGRRIVIRQSTGEREVECAQTWCINKIDAIRKSPSATHEITLDAACTKWYIEVGKYQSRPEGVLSRIKNILQDFDGSICLSQINRNDINNFIFTSHNKNRSNATINRYLCLLSAVCTRAKNYWECNTPDFKILSFRQKEKKENIKYFKDWNEIQTILDYSPEHLRPIILTALYTGLRRGRILSLTWDQIDWDNNQIIYMGKDGQPHSVPMVKPLRAELEKLPRDKMYVFTYAGHKITDISHSWRAAFNKSGLPYRSFHTLRHTTATWLLRQTGNLRVVQNVLGHHAITTTTKYAHLVNNESQNALDDLFTK